MLALLLIPTLPLVRFNALKKSFEITNSKTLEKQKYWLEVAFMICGGMGRAEKLVFLF